MITWNKEWEWTNEPYLNQGTGWLIDVVICIGGQGPTVKAPFYSDKSTLSGCTWERWDRGWWWLKKTRSWRGRRRRTGGCPAPSRGCPGRHPRHPWAAPGWRSGRWSGGSPGEWGSQSRDRINWAQIGCEWLILQLPDHFQSFEQTITRNVSLPKM